MVLLVTLGHYCCCFGFLIDVVICDNVVFVGKCKDGEMIEDDYGSVVLSVC